jgi:hypothetical protein
VITGEAFMSVRFGVAVCSVFCAASLWVNDGATADAPPTFWVESSQLEIGPVTAGSMAVAEFTFHNEGDADVHIVRAAPS